MTPLYKILLSILLTLNSFSSTSQDILQVWYPDQLNILPNCKISGFEKKFPVTTNSSQPIKIYSLKSNSNEYSVAFDGKSVNEYDTFSVSESRPLTFVVKFKTLPKNQDSLFLSFETNIDSMEIFKYVKIPFFFKEHILSSSDISESKNHVIDLSNSCLDSIRVYFPVGGTETTIKLFNSKSLKRPIKSLWYQFADENSFITFSKKDIGRYVVTLGSCHWAGKTLLTIK